MRTVDRYLLIHFLRGFCVTLISLLGLYVVADFMGNLAEFVDQGKQGSGVLRTVLQYYGARLPWFLELTGRVVVLLAAVLTLGNLHRHNEWTALMAAGVSPWRVAKPLVFTAVAISLVAVVNREWAVPRVRDALCRSVKEMSGKRPARITPQYDHRSDILFEGDTIRYDLGQIIKPRFHLPTHWAPVGQNLSAATGVFVAAQAGRPPGYLLRGLDPAIDWEALPDYKVYDTPVVLTARHHPWIPKSDAVFVVSSLSLEQLHRGHQWQQYSSTSQLIAGLHSRSLDYGANTRVLIHSRFVQPLLDMTLLLFGLPIVLVANRSNVVMAAGRTILLVVFFTLVVLAAHMLGSHGVLTPALAAWAPLFVLVPLAALHSGPLFS